MNVIVFAVDHPEYQTIDFPSWLKNKRPAILDANNVLSPTQREMLKSLGCRIESIGRG